MYLHGNSLTTESWSDFYEGQYTKYSQTTSFSSTKTSNFYFSLCIFCSLSAPCGGSICITSSSDANKVLIESSSFVLCTSTGNSNGAAIYIGMKGQIVTYKACGYMCYSQYNKQHIFGQMIYSEVSVGSNFKNYFLFNSAVRCGSSYGSSNSVLDSEQRHGSVYIINGIQEVKNVNSSHNTCRHSAGFYISGSSSEKHVNVMKFSTIFDNTNECISMGFQSGRKYDMVSCNVVGNRCTDSLFNFFHVNGVLNINSCILINNVYATSKLFTESLTHDVTISNSYIDADPSSYPEAKVTNLLNIGKTHLIVHANIGICTARNQLMMCTAKSVHSQRNNLIYFIILISS